MRLVARGVGLSINAKGSMPANAQPMPFALGHCAFSIVPLLESRWFEERADFGLRASKHHQCTRGSRRGLPGGPSVGAFDGFIPRTSRVLSKPPRPDQQFVGGLQVIGRAHALEARGATAQLLPQCE